MNVMKRKILLISLLCVALCFVAVSCQSAPQTSTPNGTSQQTSTDTESPIGTLSENATTVALNGDDVTITGEGVEFKDGKVVISKSGEYTFSGKLNDGQIYVNVTKSDRVYIILNGAEITCSNSAAIYIACADKTTIIANKGTINKLTDGKGYKFDATEDEPNACIYSADDMTIKGEGSLEVIGNYKNGISSKNDITIKELILSVKSYNTAIRGKDSVEIESGTITIDAGNDGIKSSNADEPGKGYVLITGGTITIDAGDDCIQGETDVTISGGTVNATAGGKDVNCAGTTNIKEGCLK